MSGLAHLLDMLNVPVSYAQELEDIILFKYLYSVENGFYIDVGCNHPQSLSVTKFFYERGWTGINIDPLKEMMDLYKDARPKDINMCIGVSDKDGIVEFFEAGSGSTMDAGDAARRGLTNKTTITVTTLAKILDSIPVERDIHFLKIDVEMGEKQVLLGCDFKKYRPWVLVIESTLPLTFVPCHEDWEYILTDNGYSLLCAQGINRYYCADEKRQTVVDNFIQSPMPKYLQVDDFHLLSKIALAFL